MKTKLIVAVVLLAAAGGGGYWWWTTRTQERVAAQAPTTQAVEATRGNLVVQVSATGAIEPAYTVEIKSKASGTIQNVHVEEGAQVEQGALLIEIDPVVEKRKVTQAEADLKMAEAQRGNTASKLNYSQGQLKRDEGLLKQGLVSRDAVDQLRREVAVYSGEIQVAQAQVLRAKAAFDEARDRLNETKIYAPGAGTILERLVNPGQVITAGTATGGETLLTLADLSRLFVRVKVDEADVAQVKVGQQVSITADALPGKVFAGAVLRVAPQGKVESSVTVFEVVVEISGAGLEELRPMLSANVEIRVGEAQDVVLVPREALRQRRGKSLVEVEGQGPVEVEVGLTDDRQVEIRSGLQAGARVLVPTAKRTPGGGTRTNRQQTGVPGLNLGGGMPGGGRIR